MIFKIEKNDKFTNYKLTLSDINVENDIVNFLKSHNLEFTKTEYFENFFMYNIKNINSKIANELKNNFENYIQELIPMSVYSLPLRIDDEKGELTAYEKDFSKKYITLGILDNGVAKNSQLKDWVIDVDNKYSEENTGYTHGTFVAGIALYGDILENKKIIKNDKFNILDSTVLSATTIEEDELLKNIQLGIEKNYKKVKIWNLSLSVKQEIFENYFSTFGVLMDYLQKKYNVLVCKSGGNDGGFMKKRPKQKLYQGSDSLLALVTASITNEGKSSSYSRLGLGVKKTLKPDVASYGGELTLEDDGSMGMIGVKSLNKKGDIVSSTGTSFANARISSLSATIYQNICKDFENFSDFDATLIKALIIHSAVNTKQNLTFEEIGYGIPKDAKEILSYLNSENFYIIQDKMKKNKKINLSEKFGNIKTKFKITLCYETEFDFYQKNDYILSDIKIKNISDDGVNLTRKIEIELDTKNEIELYSNNDIEKKYTLIFEKL